MSDNLFPKFWSLRVDNLDVAALDIEFKVLRTLKSEPNRCVLTVWNLSADHRAQLLLRNRPSLTPAQIAQQSTKGKAQGISVSLSAGYVNNFAELFAGDLREVASTRTGNDWKTTISGDDGGVAHREGRINAHFAKGTPIGTVLKQCAAAFGIGAGNVANYAAGASIDGVGTTIPHSITLSGNVATEMDRICNSIGVTWSIQSGALQLLPKGQPLAASAILLSPATGLYDSPAPSIDSTVSLGNAQQYAPGGKQKVAKPPKAKSTSVIKLKCAILPGLIPGRKIVLDSAALKGDYMLTECEYVGQSWASQWEVNCIARVYQ